jgi:hypothetical protein
MAENIRKQAQDVQANSVINYLNMCKHSIRNAMNYQTIHESNFKKHPDYDDYKTFLQPRIAKFIHNFIKNNNFCWI